MCNFVFKCRRSCAVSVHQSRRPRIGCRRIKSRPAAHFCRSCRSRPHLHGCIGDRPQSCGRPHGARGQSQLRSHGAVGWCQPNRSAVIGRLGNDGSCSNRAQTGGLAGLYTSKCPQSRLQYCQRSRLDTGEGRMFLFDTFTSPFGKQ